MVWCLAEGHALSLGAIIIVQHHTFGMHSVIIIIFSIIMMMVMTIKCIKLYLKRSS